MKYLNNLKQGTPCSWLKDALNSKRKDKFHLLKISKNIIPNRYIEYDSIVSQTYKKPEKTRFKRAGKLLIDYYNSPPQKLHDKIKERRNNHGLRECPYCGNPVIPDTLDHFLPKDDWPDFSIFPNNLIPQCRECAPIKGAKYYDNDLCSVLFLNPVYEEMLSKMGFEIDISFIKEKPIFTVSFQFNGEINEKEIHRLKTHIESLKIVSRINSYCHREYSSWKALIKANSFDIKKSFKTRLEEVSSSVVNENWKISFFDAFLKNPKALSHLQSFSSKKIISSDKSISKFRI